MSTASTHEIAFQLYDLAWRLALPWLRRSSRLAWGYDQRSLRRQLPAADIWIQAASVGEAYLAVELVPSLAAARPAAVLATSGTRQGVEVLAANLPRSIPESGDRRLDVQVGCFPFDRPALMQAAVKQVRPQVMVLLETEIWPGLLNGLKQSGSRVLIVNGRMSPGSLKRYRLWPTFWRRLSPDKILAVSPSDADRFARLFGGARVQIMPNMKFDRLPSPAAGSGRSAALKPLLPPGTPFIVLASIRRAEEAPVAKLIQRLLERRPQALIGLFPRHMHRVAAWQRRLDRLAISAGRRSCIDAPAGAGTVLIWDTIGELAAAYRLAGAAFVGGSLAPLGGQNFLEALAGGVIPVSGPWWDNFAWVGRQIVDDGLLRVAADWRQAADLILMDLDSPPRREQVAARLEQFIGARRGGTATACRHIIAGLENNLSRG